MNKLTHHLKQINGTSIVELLVSMGLFTVIMTITVQFYITMSRLQQNYRDTANLQQEGRIISEVFSRYAREAPQVYSSTAYGNNICASSSYIAFSIKDDPNNALVFNCTQDIGVADQPYRLKMGLVSLSAGQTISSLPAGYDASLASLNTAQSSITNFTISRSTISTYPKTLRYNFEIKKADTTGTNEGDKIDFEGYLNMKNEL